MPTTVTWGVCLRFSSRHSTAAVWEKLRPSTLSGRPMTSRVTPVFRAASAFSQKPPLLPVCLVTSTWALAAFSMAIFSSSEKGPCMAMVLAVGSPASRQAARLLSTGSTRA